MSTITETESYLNRLFSYSDTLLTPRTLLETVVMAYSKHKLTEVQIQEILKDKIK